ncbi:hypothetical protein [Bradyrhizobium sp. SZCCHNRI2010]|uniref:hypothetical protein n=1 Tax=Bradyrhizobium sp. SZCCHNRI2010 TaxID=3057283 RepID=UPI0028E7737A|nr:hypothetical protein [Bradyrhizobium sp. SZCCHNRI2010]
MPKFNVNDWVRSVAVGSKESFVGQVTGFCEAGYIVRCAENKRWGRSDDQLDLVNDDAKRLVCGFTGAA